VGEDCLRRRPGHVLSANPAALSLPLDARPDSRHVLANGMLRRRCNQRLQRLPKVSIGWRRGVVVSGVRRMNEVNARRARLVPGW